MLIARITKKLIYSNYKLVLKGVKLQFSETKEFNVFWNEHERIIIILWEGLTKIITIDEFMYTVINIHINLSLVYEKATYQVKNINLRKHKHAKLPNQLHKYKRDCYPCDKPDHSLPNGDITKMLVSELKNILMNKY